MPKGNTHFKLSIRIRLVDGLYPLVVRAKELERFGYRGHGAGRRADLFPQQLQRTLTQLFFLILNSE